jgi:hypothetical protein
MNRVAAELRIGGALVIGSHERLPPVNVACEAWFANLPIYRRVG